MAETPLDTQTTDENGIAELTSPAIDVIGTKGYIVKHGIVEYPTSVEVVEVNNIELIKSSQYTYDGSDIMITATVTDANLNPIDDIKITINGEVLKTDNEGKVYYTYFGTGTGGNIQITANCGTETATTTIEDVMIYWSQTEGKKYNLNYNTKGQITVTELQKGIKLSTPVLGTSNMEGRIYFPNPYRLLADWEFSFTVKSFNKYTSYMLTSLVDISSRVVTNSQVKVTYNNSTGVRKVFVDNVEVHSSVDVNDIQTDIIIAGEVLIDNVKLMGGW